jgi:hypothetical protein
MTLIPVQITFRGLPHSDALEADIRERVVWLEQFYTDIVGCRIVVEKPHRHRHDGHQLVQDFAREQRHAVKIHDIPATRFWHRHASRRHQSKAL